MSRTLPFFAVAAVLLTGCPSDGTRPGAPIDVTRITPGAPSPAYVSGLVTAQRTAIFDAETFATTWTKAFGSGESSPAPPAVDFTEDFVVVVALGERASGGYVIEVTGALDEGEGVRVGVQTTTPGKGCPVTLSMTQPVDMVRLKRPTAGTVLVRFEERVVSIDCGP